ncbi:phospholipid carrier-dependent glycosyltransferase [Rubripirellula lacrimiformis]|nr:phospholipid carrier-dependent glycosyltransferase [Rubripirellula lacrimiformis]
MIGLVVRGAVVFAFMDDFEADPDAYRAIADTLSQSGVYGMTGFDGQVQPTAFRPPLYPALLSWTSTSPIAIAMLHTLLGGLTVLAVYVTARHWTVQVWPPAMAALMVGIDPILLQQSTLVMTETLAAFIVTAVLWQWSSPADQFEGSVKRTIHAVALGLLLGLAYLCRPTFLVWAVFIVIGHAWISLRRTPRVWGRMVPSIALAAVVVAMVGAWTMRNVRQLGHPVWATTHGGYTLLLANNPMFYRYLREGDVGTVWDPNDFFEAYAHRYDGDPTTQEFWQTDWSSTAVTLAAVEATEVSDDRLVGNAAKAAIRREPEMFFGSAVVRVVRLWNPMPHLTPGRSMALSAAIGVYYAVFYVLAFLGWAKWKRRSGRSSAERRAMIWPVFAMVVTLTAVHAVYWSNLRMRAPSIPGLAIIAALVCYRDDCEKSDWETSGDVANR